MVSVAIHVALTVNINAVFKYLVDGFAAVQDFLEIDGKATGFPIFVKVKRWPASQNLKDVHFGIIFQRVTFY